ncbi:BnaA05g19060D [Brassica napus]|uniref:BnaA05g19060D protein n=1 Tax=Brassica napus TaxID=3708 RepID=A0A078GL84_BRANA|nr:BnaA05g19060D [Brassica napus]
MLACTSLPFLIEMNSHFPLTQVLVPSFLQGIWTIFPYMVAAATALYLYIRSRYTPKT